jgi:hypothetical protein
MTLQPAVVDFAGELHTITPGGSLEIGREGALAIEDNPFLHRRFLQIHDHDGMWWLSNVGTHLTATLADDGGSVQSWLSPGASLPLVFQKTFVWFTAGPTTYELEVTIDDAPFVHAAPSQSTSESTTVGALTFTPEQKLLLVALCEPALKRASPGPAVVPTSAEAAARLGWRLTKFNRKLDNVCQRVAARGVRGLHGGPENLATNRRARLVEYALAARVVSKDDLSLLVTPRDLQV